MTAIWRNDGTGWRLLDHAGFPDEATLHKLVEEAPQMLPLAGEPRLVILGREVQLGTGFADLIAIDQAGRLTIVEIKLARNSESRRAVIAQVLTYAAYLDGIDPEQLERDVLGRHLHSRGYESLAVAVAANDQTGSFSELDFTEGLRASLRDGRFRLVIVLDSAPDELSRLVGYLGKVAPELLIDLVTVTSYEVNGSEVIVPQRVEPGRADPPKAASPTLRPNGTTSDGAGAFLAAIAAAPEGQHDGLQRLAAWAESLEREGLVTLKTYSSPLRQILLPRLRQDDAGLVSVASDGGGQLWLFRSVFERRAPEALARLEALIAPMPVKQGNTLKVVTDEVLGVIADGYREAVRSLTRPSLPGHPPGGSGR